MTEPLEPSLSVVVIVYNDAERLPVAVQSVLDQTLHSVETLIVDDRSTDDSFAVARRLAEQYPGRVRAFQLEENSGGCGGPRNRGIAEARGEYMMFLDSDDTLEREACRNFLDAARSTGAELLSGMSHRVRVQTGKVFEWYPWLYGSTRTFDSIMELPDLLVYDTLSTNKCYRRDFLLDNDLRFPVGIHYEDLLFSARAYLAARKITLIPNHVYNWMVDDSGDGARSISNRRHEVENFAHRVRIHRMIDEIFRDRGMHELKLHKDTKFLKHDLVLHLRDLPFLDADYRTQFAELARGYMAQISQEAYARLEPIHAICAYLLMEEDWVNLDPAINTLINRETLSAPLAERDGRVYWCAEHLDDEHGRAVLDVTDLGYHAKPLHQMTLGNKLRTYRQTRGGVELSGAIVNPLGRIGAGAALEGKLLVRARRKGQQFTFPVTEVRHAGDHILWRTEAPLSRTLRPLGLVDPVWDVKFQLTVDGTAAKPGLLTVGDAEFDTDVPLRVRPRLTRLVSDSLRAETSSKGHLAFVLDAHGPVTRRSRAVLDHALEGMPGTVARSGLRKAKSARKNLRSGETKLRVYHEVFSKLPVRKGMVVFESHLGKQYSDSPRAIYEEMRRQGLDFTAVWAYADRPDDFPQDATLVKRWSYDYLRALAQAQFWVDNQGFPLKLTKRPETTYIQTWHGSALKKMGFDSPQFRVRTKDQQADYQKVLDRFDHFLIRSEHDARTLVPAFRLVDDRVVRSGYPRNDALVAARDAERASGVRDRGELARTLGIPEDRKVLLYAPTFRSTAAGAVRKFEPPLDFDEFADRFGDRYTLLVRSHYLNSVVLPPSVRGRVFDVSTVPDVTPLYLMADALITDYSSVMFDYALLDRPILFYAYDYDAYVKDDRGTYFDLVKHAPGPVVRDTEGLYAALDGLGSMDTEWQSRRKQFVADFGEYDQGDAARQVVEKIIRPRSGK